MYNANARIRSVERPNLFIVKTSTSLTRRICLMFKIVLKVAVVSFTLMTSVSLSLIKQFRSLSILEVTGGFAHCKFPPTALRVHPLTESEFALTFTSLPQIFGFLQQNLFLLCLNHNMYQITCYFFAMANMISTVISGRLPVRPITRTYIIMTSGSTITRGVDDSYTFECKVYSNFSANVTWLINGKPISLDGKNWKY